MWRTSITAALALLVIWQSECLTINNGALVNRCGLWQRVTGQPMSVVLGPLIRTMIVYQDRDRIIEVPKVIYQDRVIEKTVVQQAPPTIIYQTMPSEGNAGMIAGNTSMSMIYMSNPQLQRRGMISGNTSSVAW